MAVLLLAAAGELLPPGPGRVEAAGGGARDDAGVTAAGGVGDAAADLGDLRVRRLEAWRLLAGAREREAEAVRKLLAAEARVQDARDRLAGARRRAAAAREDYREAADAAAALEGEVARRRRVVDAWLRFLYEEGPVTYLDVLLGATDFYDFTTRLDVLSRIIGGAVSRLREVRTLHEGLVQRRTELAARAADLAAAERRLASALREAEEEERRRAVVLAEARALLGARAGALDRLDTLWRERLPSLRSLLARLPTLDWRRVPPDAVEPEDGASGRWRVVLGQATVRKWLFAPEPELAHLRLLFRPGRVTVAEGEGAGETWRLEGRLEVAGGRARWVPERLDFLGVPLGARALADVAASPGLVLPLDQAAAPLRLLGVEVEEGAIVLHLGG